MRAELVPPTVKGRFRGRPRLAVDNLGNTKVTASLSGNDTGDRLSYEIQPANVQIEPGRAAFVRTTLKPRQIIWFGSKEEHPYKLALRRSGAPATEVDGTYVQRGFLPRWLATALSVAVALSIAFVMIWLAYKPQVSSGATEKLQEAGVSTLPPPSPTATAGSAAPVVSQAPVVTPPAAQETEDADSDGDGGGGGGGGGGASQTPKQQKATAATAVQQLAARSDGRHICYRAYVADRGWQDPVCDGAEAGTVGKGLPIKAVNIAVSGTKGVSGNGAFTIGGWKTGDKWSHAADGIDMYIGSTKESDSALEGYTIEVNDGSVCQNAHVMGGNWTGLACTKPGEWMYGGDPMGGGQQLTAVRFTV
ncbi:hydrogenase expression protein [Streptomyces fumigatiscleroticus]|nr:hydrogenase expression protein [Streptomyces fumigatiscleroticus]